MYFCKGLCLALILSVFVYVIGVDGDCPKPNVFKNNQIYGGKNVVPSENVNSAKQCYLMCCERSNCTTAMIKYEKVMVSGDDGKQKEVVTKNCQLLDCRPSISPKCSMETHSSFAVIELPQPLSPTTAQKKELEVKDTTTSTTAVPEVKKKKALLKKTPPPPGTIPKTECPPGVPMPMCSEDLCQKKNGCPAHPQPAKCKMNFCGGCNVDYFDEDGNKLNCIVAKPEKTNIPAKLVAPTPVAKAPVDKAPVAKAPVAKAPVAKAPVAKLIPPVADAIVHKARPTTTKPGKVVTQKKLANEQAVVVAPEDYQPNPEEHPDLSEPDPYYQSEKRKWITEKDHILPSRALPLDTEKADEKKIDYADVPIMKIPVPTKDDAAGLTSVTAIPLLVALIICIVALIAIVLKYRFHCAKRGKPRKFKIDDGDYLINGMYL